MVSIPNDALNEVKSWDRRVHVLEIALKCFGAPAFAICSNHITSEQTPRIASKATEIGVPVGVMFDNDVEGERGAKQAAYELAQHCPVRVVWSSKLFGGTFRDRQPESLISEEWEEIHAAVGSRRTAN